MYSIQAKKIQIKFNKSFYSRDSLNQTQAEYQKICKTIIHEKDLYFTVEIAALDSTLSLKKLALEFSNYALSLQK
jgi:prolyl-tRNA editing enzyme YbaK/EbsC (Cys-tRNA(Pro) deacylase)